MSTTWRRVRIAMLAAGFGAAVIATAAQAARDNGWWVVLGSVATPDNNFTPQAEAAVRHISAAARRCGLRPFQDFSSKFTNFAPGYAVVVAGAYARRTDADQALARVRRCIDGAYVKRGSYAGE